MSTVITAKVLVILITSTVITAKVLVTLVTSTVITVTLLGVTSYVILVPIVLWLYVLVLQTPRCHGIARS